MSGGITSTPQERVTITINTQTLLLIRVALRQRADETNIESYQREYQSAYEEVGRAVHEAVASGTYSG